MSDDRVFELLSAAADDELTAAEQTELEELLQDSSRAREIKAGFDRLEAIMNDVSEMQPPTALQHNILDKLSPRKLDETSKLWSWLHPIRSGAALRYGFSAAVGAALVIAVYESQPDLRDIPDIAEFAGTIAPDAEDDQRIILDTYSFEQPGVTSFARLEHRDGALMLDVRIDTKQPLEVAVDFAIAGLHVDALAQTERGFDSIQYANDILRVTGRGQRRFTVLLRASDGGPSASEAEIALEFSSDGKLLQQGTLNSVR